MSIDVYPRMRPLPQIFINVFLFKFIKCLLALALSGARAFIQKKKKKKEKKEKKKKENRTERKCLLALARTAARAFGPLSPPVRV